MKYNPRFDVVCCDVVSMVILFFPFNLINFLSQNFGFLFRFNLNKIKISLTDQFGEKHFCEVRLIEETPREIFIPYID